MGYERGSKSIALQKGLKSKAIPLRGENKFGNVNLLVVTLGRMGGVGIISFFYIDYQF
jgi:hypothetical protein